MAITDKAKVILSEIEKRNDNLLIYATAFLIFIAVVILFAVAYPPEYSKVQASSVSRISEKYTVEKIGKISKSYKGVTAIAIDDMNDDSKKDIVTMDQYGHIFILYRR